MRKGILVIITTLLFIGVKGQDLDWIIQSGSVSVPDNNISVDALGNTYVVASALTTIYFGSGSNSVVVSPSGSLDQVAFLVKYDSQGNFLWVREMNSSIRSYVLNFSVDDDGNSYVSGQFEGSIDFDSNITTDNLTDYNPYGTGFLAKYDSNGNFLWSEVANGMVNAISNSEFLLCGLYDSSKDFDFGNGTHYESVFDSVGGAYVAKYDAMANLIWVRTISDGTQIGANWVEEKNGEIYLSGYKTVYDTNVVWGYHSDSFIAKFGLGGNLDWKRDIGAEGYDVLMGYEVDDSGNLYLAGNFQNTVDFNPGGIANDLISVGWHDLVVAKFNTAGINEWAHSISDVLDIYNPNGGIRNQILSMDYDSQEGLLLAGSHLTELEVNHSGGTAFLPGTTGRGAFVMNFDDSGTYKFGETVKGSGNFDVHVHGVAFNNNEGFYLSGHFHGLVDFDLGLGVSNRYSVSDGLFLAKYSFNTVGIIESDIVSGFSLYPNPAFNKINIDFENEEQLVNLQIVNIHGQQVFSKEYSNTENIQLDIEGFSSGIYMVNIITPNGQKTVKFIKK